MDDKLILSRLYVLRLDSNPKVLVKLDEICVISFLFFFNIYLWIKDKFLFLSAFIGLL